MKVFLSVLFSAMIVFAVQAKDGERDYPMWFVVNHAEEDVASVATEAKETAESSREVVSEKEGSEIKPRKLRMSRTHLAKKEKKQEENRFAKNNKDLLLAEKLLKHVYQKNISNNFVVSPLSFYTVSVLLANGVVDETLFEFSSMFPVLHLAEVDKVLKTYIDSKKESIELPNALWSGSFSEHYKTLMQEYLGAELWGMEDSTKIINDWVNARTQGGLRTFGDPEKAMLEDVYASGGALFKIMKAPFRTQKTTIRQFFNIDETVSNIKFLQGEVVAGYFENEDMQILKLTYPSGDKLTLWLPNSDIDFEEFVEEVDASLLNFNFEKKEVKVIIPEIDITYAIKNVADVYEQMGVKRIFEKENYDFAKMISFDNATKVKKVFLNARVIMRENVSDDETEELSAKISFEADHPFIFMINDGDFIGAYVSGKK